MKYLHTSGNQLEGFHELCREQQYLKERSSFFKTQIRLLKKAVAMLDTEKEAGRKRNILKVRDHAPAVRTLCTRALGESYAVITYPLDANLAEY